MKPTVEWCLLALRVKDLTLQMMADCFRPSNAVLQVQSLEICQILQGLKSLDAYALLAYERGQVQEFLQSMVGFKFPARDKMQ